MTDHFEAFAAAARLEQGAKIYGDRSFQQAPDVLAGEVEQELLGVCAWSFILWLQTPGAAGADAMNAKRQGNARLLLLVMFPAFLCSEIEADHCNDGHPHREHDQRSIFLHRTIPFHAQHTLDCEISSTPIPEALNHNADAEKAETYRKGRHRPPQRHHVALHQLVQDGEHGHQDGGFPQVLADHLSGSLALGAVGGCQRQRHGRAGPYGNRAPAATMNAKRKGTRNEHKSRRLLATAGYAVTRAAGSLGAWDLVGIGPTDVVLLQVKSNRAPSPAERETLTLFPCPVNCERLLFVWHGRPRWPEL